MLFNQFKNISYKPFVIYRYVKENVRRSGIYRNYNKVLPEWLHDKPQKFTRHCAERITSAKAIKKSDIEVRSMENLIFQVHSSSSNDVYTITLGDKMTMPQCTCEDWGKNLMPCKHMFAIMDHIECVSWQSFSEKYRLDNTVVSEDGIANQPIDDGILKNNIEKSQVKETKYNELKKRAFMKRSEASTCRELLNQIRNLSFVVYDNDVLDRLHDKLIKLIETLKYHAPKDESLILEKPNVVRNVSTSCKFSTLPKPKLKKSNITGRVVISAERKRKARSITVIDPKIKKTNIIEEQPCFDPNDVYNISMEGTIKDLTNVNDSTTDNDGQKDCLKFDFEILETENPKSCPNKAIPEMESLVLEEDIFITKEVPASGKINVNRNLKFTN